jgi:hypothetical protein
MSFRVTFHAFLAIFTGMVLIKINEPSLIFDLETNFNGRVALLHGSAPDQYRILPFLGIRAIYETLRTFFPQVSFNAAMQVFNAASAFFLFEITHRVLRENTNWKTRNLLIFNGLFAIGHAYTQVLYWKPDTLFGLFFCVLAIYFFLNKNRTGSIFTIIALAFCRADVALFYGVFYSFYVEKDSRFWGNCTRILTICLPILIQFYIQKHLFPKAAYFCDVFQFYENLRIYHLLIIPFSYLLVCIFMLFGKQILQFFRENWKQWRIAFLMMFGYFCLIFTVARISEFRLFLPMLPILLFIFLKNYKF